MDMANGHTENVYDWLDRLFLIVSVYYCDSLWFSDLARQGVAVSIREPWHPLLISVMLIQYANDHIAAEVWQSPRRLLPKGWPP